LSRSIEYVHLKSNINFENANAMNWPLDKIFGLKCEKLGHYVALYEVYVYDSSLI